MSDPHKDKAEFSAEERELGMEAEITRRDFINQLAAGTGAALLSAAAPGLAKSAEAASSSTPGASWHPWTGYAGVGDYSISNGNTWDVVSAGHGIRDALYDGAIPGATQTGEIYDLVIVGGGFAGVIAAYTFLKETKRQRSCLVLEDHPIIGGEAKRNEFLVRGQRLIGPQGSNEADIPTEGWRAQMWRDIGVPTEFEFARLPTNRRAMDIPLENYEFYLWADNSENHGYFFDTPQPHWVSNPWGHGLEGTPWSPELRRDMIRWRDEPVSPFQGDETALARWLDTMTYDDYLIKVRKLNPEVARFADPLLASGAGLGCDALSAYVPYYFEYPGFKGLFNRKEDIPLEAPGRKMASAIASRMLYSFPGGNDGIMRCLVKWLNPEAIEGANSFTDIHNGKIHFEAMDRPGTPCRLRAGATVVRVSHDPESSQRKAKPAIITYAKGGKLFSVQARTVIWAGASWSAKHAVQRLPSDYKTAMEGFPRSPMLVVNVALDNWRALYKLGYSACSWRGGFGFTANIRAPMYVGDYRPPLDPDFPTVLTFYVPFNQYGLPIAEQGKVARQQMFGTSYRDYEAQIRRQLTKMLGDAGFDAQRDIAGIVLNRWGHAYVNAGPGFFYGRDGKPAPSDVLRTPLGNLTFAHSELSGHQTYIAAGEEGVRAAKQVIAML